MLQHSIVFCCYSFSYFFQNLLECHKYTQNARIVSCMIVNQNCDLLWAHITNCITIEHRSEGNLTLGWRTGWANRKETWIMWPDFRSHDRNSVWRSVKLFIHMHLLLVMELIHFYITLPKTGKKSVRLPPFDIHGFSSRFACNQIRFAIITSDPEGCCVHDQVVQQNCRLNHIFSCIFPSNKNCLTFSSKKVQISRLFPWLRCIYALFGFAKLQSKPFIGMIS